MSPTQENPELSVMDPPAGLVGAGDGSPGAGDEFEFDDDAIAGEAVVVLAAQAFEARSEQIAALPIDGVEEVEAAEATLETPPGLGLSDLDPVLADISATGLFRAVDPALFAREGGEAVPGADESAVAAAEEQLLRTMVVRFDPARPLAEVLAQLADVESIDEVSPAAEYRAERVAGGSMPSVAWGIAEIQCPEAWRTTVGDRSVRVAVLDSGADFDHPRLAPLLSAGANFVTLGTAPKDDSAGGHGTHIAGTVAALPDNGEAVGVNWVCTVVPVKVLDGRGRSTPGSVLGGLIWAARTARVINCSWGSRVRDLRISAGVDFAIGCGAVVVACMGNQGSGGNRPFYPAAHPGVIAVGAVDGNCQRSVWPIGSSNTGRWISLVAPGTDILSLIPGGGTAMENGTSTATPHVSGVLALLLSVNPGLSAGQLKKLLLANARPLRDDQADPVPNSTYGAGLLDAGAAVDAARQTLPPSGAHAGSRSTSASNREADARAVALYWSMVGRLGTEAGFAGGLPAPANLGKGKTVLILGAGVAGLTAAFELCRRGYECTVLEAQNRVGGRNRTARKGDALFEIGALGLRVATHTCDFADGLYLNLGPGRIPHHHRRVLQYCRDFHVALEPYVMETPANLTVHHSNGGTPVRWRNRQAANDTRGWLAEKLAATTIDAEQRDLLRLFGDLDKTSFKYLGSARSGYSDELDISAFPKPAESLKLKQLTDSEFWKGHFYQSSDYLWQDTMFQPIGGMDKIATAFQREITERFGSHVIKLKAVVTKIELLDDARVAVTFRQGLMRHTMAVDFCVSTIPLPVLKEIKMIDFSPEFHAALSAVDFAPTCKVGWQANRRFWEEEPDEIYGGISRTDHNITQLWYPSNGFFSANGTLTGAYNYDKEARALGNLRPDLRLQLARAGAAELHEQFTDETIVPTAKGISIAWHKVPYQLGGWAAWDPTESKHMAAYTRLLQPEGHFFFAGDQASPLPGWMEGAMMSAHYVIEQIGGRIERQVSGPVQVPDSVALTQGLV